jgi:hypothetical protein
MNTNYKFVSKSNDDYRYNPAKKIFKYYQLCSFKNPYNNKHHIKRFVINHMNEFVSIDEKYIDVKQYMKFIKTHRLNEYKLHNAYDLNNIAHPGMGEITFILSPILQTDSDYTGFAKF